MTENENFVTPKKEEKDLGEEALVPSPIKEIFDYKDDSVERDIKKEIKKAALITTIPFLILFGISYYWSYLYFYIGDTFGVSRETAISFMQDTYVQNIFQIVLSSLMFIFPFCLILKTQRKSIAQIVSLNRPKKQVAFLYYLVGFSFCMLSNLLVSVAGTFFSGFGVDYSVNFGKNPQGILGLILTIVSTAIVPALVEEFACRGVVLGSLLPFGEGFAVIVSSVLFGVMHGNFEQMPFAFLVGLILGFVRVKTNSLWICILIHFSNNMFSVLNDYLSMLISNNTQYIFYVIFIALLLIIGIIAIVRLEKTDETFAFKSCEDDEKVIDRYKWFFTAPTTVVFLILFIFKSLRYFK